MVSGVLVCKWQIIAMSDLGYPTYMYMYLNGVGGAQ